MSDDARTPTPLHVCADCRRFIRGAHRRGQCALDLEDHDLSDGCSEWAARSPSPEDPVLTVRACGSGIAYEGIDGTMPAAAEEAEIDKAMRAGAPSPEDQVGAPCDCPKTQADPLCVHERVINQRASAPESLPETAPCPSCGSTNGPRGACDPRFCRRCDDALVADELEELRADRSAWMARADKAEAALVKLAASSSPRESPPDDAEALRWERDNALARAAESDGWRHVAAYYLGDYVDTHSPVEARAEALRRAFTPNPFAVLADKIAGRSPLPASPREEGERCVFCGHVQGTNDCGLSDCRCMRCRESVEILARARSEGRRDGLMEAVCALVDRADVAQSMEMEDRWQEAADVIRERVRAVVGPRDET